MFTEAEQFWYLLANWRPRRTNVVVPAPRPIGLKSKGWCFSSCPKAGRIWCASRKAVGQAVETFSYSKEEETFCFIQAFNLLTGAH